MQKQSIKYLEALNDIEYLVNEKVLDIWKASIIMGIMFDLPKEQALDELLELRKRRLGITNPK